MTPDSQEPTVRLETHTHEPSAPRTRTATARAAMPVTLLSIGLL